MMALDMDMDNSMHQDSMEDRKFWLPGKKQGAIPCATGSLIYTTVSFYSLSSAYLSPGSLRPGIRS